MEFERLVCDVIQIREGVFIQTFKPGPDGGIDGLYRSKDQKIIIQAKRFNNFNSLMKELRASEIEKIRKQNPSRYILGASLDFSPPQKEKILELFDGLIHNDADILSQTDINRLLEDPKYHFVEAAHPKLWLPSLPILKKFLSESTNQSLYNESAQELQEALRVAQRFVPTRLYQKALRNWSQNNVVIITGEPGVGKTTMAYLLAISHLQPNDLDGFVWANSIKDIYHMLDLEDYKKQVFILDDFWGSIFHNDNTRRNDEIQLNKLIQRIIHSNGKKRLILTTREYILQQGLQKQPNLKETLDRHAVICTIEQYSEAEKAQILFQHLYHSNLPYEYVARLFRDYDQIIRHDNYSPRVLALYLEKQPDHTIAIEDYCLELYEYFDQPGALWESIFLELSQEAQIIALLILISSTPMRLKDLQACYEKYIEVHANPIRTKNLLLIVSELEKTMIKSFYNDEYDEIWLNFISPSVQDFLYSHINNNKEQVIPTLVQYCCFFNQLQFLFEHFNSPLNTRVALLLENEWIMHYEDYDYSFVDSYEGNWRWGVDYLDDMPRGEEQLHKFHHMLKRCDPKVHTRLFEFLEIKIKEYCMTMGHGNMEAQYFDLQNLPYIIVQCTEKGMSFDGKETIEKFYQEAFSVNHYRSMDNFIKVFKEEYETHHTTHFPSLKKRIKTILLRELEWLDDLDMDLELDFLIDTAPDTLKEFGFRYTHKFGEKIANITGRMPSVDTNYPRMQSDEDTYIDPEERLLETIAAETKLWILGPTEEYWDEKQTLNMIKSSTIKTPLKVELKKVFQNDYTHYIHRYLRTKESINLFLSTAHALELESLPEKEMILCVSMLHSLFEKHSDQEFFKIIGFCAETLILFLHTNEPVLRRADFFDSVPYTRYLKEDPIVREIVFNNLLLQDSQWVRFMHFPIFAFCYVAALNMHIFLKEDSYDPNIELWKSIFDVKANLLQKTSKNREQISKTMYYPEFENYRLLNSDWQQTLYRMHEELIPHHFNQFHIQPRIQNYLKQIGYDSEETQVKNYLALCKYEFYYTDAGIPDSITSMPTDETYMFEYLNIISEHDTPYPEELDQGLFKELQKNDNICVSYGTGWRVLVYEIEDLKLLKRIGAYKSTLKIIRGLKDTNIRFMNGDYSCLL
nr:restriction endonuclease [Saccharibacillus endophyticus]